MSLVWKLNRLSVMEPGEIAWRARKILGAAAERSGVLTAKTPPRASHESGVAWIATYPERFDVQTYRRAADRVLAGQFDVFALKSTPLGFPPRWNRDPKSGRDAPMTFGKLLDYRNERLVGDIKYLWEPSRHGELVTLAQAWRLTRERRYSAGCGALLNSWFDQCPYPFGPHWTSSLEHGLRLVNWAFAWQLLCGQGSSLLESDEGRVFRERWLKSVYQHCRFIAGNLSRYSSANNHLIGELSGLLVAALTWPCWAESEGWRRMARRELEAQALSQNGPDGVNREQAIWYHYEVAEMMLVAGLFGRANRVNFSAAYWRRLETMLEFVASVMDVGGAVPTFGDADDAVIARLDPDEGANVFRSLLATGAVLFERPEFAFKAARFDDKSRWLLGDAAEARFGALRAFGPQQLPVRCAFREAGYYVLGDRFETREEVRLVFDAGPLGYRSIAAHGHADALSFTLSVSGLRLLIDPGTFSYHTQRAWRDYFRGTSAHNTVRLDGLDQSKSGGNFLWLAHARARVVAFSSTPDSDCIVAEHDGYERLKDPALHRRELRFDKRSSALTIIDELICDGPHDVEMFWHFAEECKLELIDGRISIRRGCVELMLTTPPQARCEIFRGSQTPLLGWSSPRFDERRPSPTVRAALRIDGSARYVTQIAVLFQTPNADAPFADPFGGRMHSGAPV